MINAVVKENISDDRAIEKSDSRQHIVRCFSSACNSYDGASRLQRVTGRKLLEANKYLFKKTVLDLGCGTGANSKLLCQLPNTTVLGCDLSLDMAKTAFNATEKNMTTLQGDATNLPFADISFNAVYSNLMLQWIDDLNVPLQELRRVLTNGGHLCFTTLLEGTLEELKVAWAGVDSDQHVNRFKPQFELEAYLSDAGFDFEIEVESVVLDYRDVTHLARELKHLGANHVKNRQTKGLTGRRKWQQLSENYPNDGRGGVPATYRVAYVVATKR